MRANSRATLFENKNPASSHEAHASVVYDAALSTMWWALEADALEDFFAKGRALGFPRFELNHQIPLEVFQSIDPGRVSISVLHDPCPAIITAKQLEREDRVITSLDESRRQSGVDVIKRTIDAACQIGAELVVIHPGRIAGDHSLDDQLRACYRHGEKNTTGFAALRQQVMDDRKRQSPWHLEALLKSLTEIVAYALETGLTLGLENRFHYYELPVFEEMQALLTEFSQPWVGWQFDVGHLQVHDELGLLSFRGWLEQFGSRIVGAHLHDVQGIVDHCAPGTGNVDFELIAAYLPAKAPRTLEVRKTLTVAEIANGMQRLAASECVSWQ